MTKPIQKKEVIQTWFAYDFDGIIEDMMTDLDMVRKSHPDVEVRLSGDYVESYGDRSFELTAYYMRSETADEIAAREAQEEANRAWRRQQFEALKKEFGEG